MGEVLSSALAGAETAATGLRGRVASAMEESGQLRRKVASALEESELLRRHNARPQQEQACEAWGEALVGRTRPPLRFRMVSHDVLSARSMEISWDNGRERLQWSSRYDPVSGRYEAEKVLPASATNVRVQFRVHIPVDSWLLPAVDRQDGCRAVSEEVSVPETFWFCMEGQPAQAVDATFEMKGLPADCHVWRAWNAERGSALPEAWEHWEESETRPVPSLCLDVLKAADDAAPQCSGAEQQLDCASKRLLAAAKCLREQRARTLTKLRELDGRLSDQWLAVNGGNTLSAGLALASAVALCIAPPVGVGLGIGSAAASGVTAASDVLADAAVAAEVRGVLCEDELNALAVADIQQEWLRAEEADMTRHASARSSCGSDGPDCELSAADKKRLKAGLGVMCSLANVAVNFGDEIASVASMSVETLAVGAQSVPTPVLALGIVGAVVSTGAAVHGWASTKVLQRVVRARMADVGNSVVNTQRWLSAASELSCSICLEHISLTDEVQCCRDSWHYTHAACLTQWAAQCRARHSAVTCPLCVGPMAPQTGVLQDMLFEAASDVAPVAEPA